MQAESALDQMDWIEKITGVIASLLSSHTPDRVISKSLGIYFYVHLFEQLCNIFPEFVVSASKSIGGWSSALCQ